MVQVNAEPWKRRLFVPNYQVREAARYAGIDPQTAAAWQKRMLSTKDKRAELSYLQLIELAVVAAARKAGMKLKDIEAAREYASAKLQSEFPFAECEFKTDGRHLLFDDMELAEGKPGAWVSADQGGQLVWKKIVNRLREFEYEDGRALRWRVAGRSRQSSLIRVFPLGRQRSAASPLGQSRVAIKLGRAIKTLQRISGSKCRT